MKPHASPRQRKPKPAQTVPPLSAVAKDAFFESHSYNVLKNDITKLYFDNEKAVGCPAHVKKEGPTLLLNFGPNHYYLQSKVRRTLYSLHYDQSVYILEKLLEGILTPLLLDELQKLTTPEHPLRSFFKNGVIVIQVNDCTKPVMRTGQKRLRDNPSDGPKFGQIHRMMCDHEYILLRPQCNSINKWLKEKAPNVTSRERLQIEQGILLKTKPNVPFCVQGSKFFQTANAFAFENEKDLFRARKRRKIRHVEYPVAGGDFKGININESRYENSMIFRKEKTRPRQIMTYLKRKQWKFKEPTQSVALRKHRGHRGSGSGSHHGNMVQNPAQAEQMRSGGFGGFPQQQPPQKPKRSTRKRKGKGKKNQKTVHPPPPAGPTGFSGISPRLPTHQGYPNSSGSGSGGKKKTPEEYMAKFKGTRINNQSNEYIRVIKIVTIPDHEAITIEIRPNNHVSRKTNHTTTYEAVLSHHPGANGPVPAVYRGPTRLGGFHKADLFVRQMKDLFTARGKAKVSSDRFVNAKVIANQRKKYIEQKNKQRLAAQAAQAQNINRPSVNHGKTGTMKPIVGPKGNVTPSLLADPNSAAGQRIRFIAPPGASGNLRMHPSLLQRGGSLNVGNTLKGSGMHFTGPTGRKMVLGASPTNTILPSALTHGQNQRMHPQMVPQRATPTSASSFRQTPKSATGGGGKPSVVYPAVLVNKNSRGGKGVTPEVKAMYDMYYAQQQSSGRSGRSTPLSAEAQKMLLYQQQTNLIHHQKGKHSNRQRVPQKGGKQVNMIPNQKQVKMSSTGTPRTITYPNIARFTTGGGGVMVPRGRAGNTGQAPNLGLNSPPNMNFGEIWKKFSDGNLPPQAKKKMLQQAAAAAAKRGRNNTKKRDTKKR